MRLILLLLLLLLILLAAAATQRRVRDRFAEETADAAMTALLGTVEVEDLDYVNVPWEDCKAQCDARPGCVMHTIHESGRSPGVGCWLKTRLKVGTARQPAILYDQCGYQGRAVALGAGTYTRADLAVRGLPDKSVSSVRVRPGYVVTLHKGKDPALQAAERDVLRVDHSVDCLLDSPPGGLWDSQTSSVTVVAVVPKP